jgi:hypothetical protein
MNEYDIPVLFQVTSVTEENAALALAHEIAAKIGSNVSLRYASTLESWHMPNHQSADGSDNPVRVVIEPIEPAYSERQALVQEIEDIVSNDTYRIVRFYSDDRPREVIEERVTLEQAKEHCNDPDTQSDWWFDGYEKED